ncbi:MAG TPA: hypothetical protein VG847_03865 [Chitinophagaceae bacterium]|nr:hypothetical protein [Chitinophagaceae bacterium]
MSAVKYFLGFVLLLCGIGLLILTALFYLSNPTITSSFLTWIAAGGIISIIMGGTLVAKDG